MSYDRSDDFDANDLERGEVSDDAGDLEFIPITFAFDSLDEAIDEMIEAIEEDAIHYPED